MKAADYFPNPRCERENIEVADNRCAINTPHPQVDCQTLIYHSEPNTSAAVTKRLEEIDSKPFETSEKLAISLSRQISLAGGVENHLSILFRSGAGTTKDCENIFRASD